VKKDDGPGLSLNQVRLITHPSEVEPENESLMGSYALDEFLEEKVEIMKRWCDWLDCIEKNIADRRVRQMSLIYGARAVKERLWSQSEGVAMDETTKEPIEKTTGNIAMLFTTKLSEGMLFNTAPTWFGIFLSEAEELYGKRNPDWTPLGIEVSDGQNETTSSCPS
jgi:hypothetical protein